MPWGLFFFPGSERRLHSHPDSPPSQAILEIRLWGCGLSIHSPALWTIPGSPHFYEVHGRGYFPSKTDGNLHSQIPRRLAHSGPVRGGIVDPPSFSATERAWDSESTLPRVHCSPANGYLSWEQFFRLSPNEGCGHARDLQRLVDLLRNGSLSPSEIVSEDAEPRVFCVPSATDETEGSIWHLVWQPLQSVDLESLSLKTALLQALASVKRMCGLQTLSVISTCLQFGPNDTKVILKPKVLSTPFSDEDQELNLLCSVRTLKIYLECYALFRQSEQFFVCFDNRTKGRPVMKQRLSRWIFDAITLGYSSLVMPAFPHWSTSTLHKSHCLVVGVV